MPLWSRGQKGVVEDSWLIALSCVCVSDVRGRLVPWAEMVIAPGQCSGIRPVLRGGVLVVVILVVVIVVVVVVVGLLLASMVSRRGGCQVSLSSRSSLEC